MSVLVMCPTRDSPAGFSATVDSVLRTSTADIAAYIDDDQVDLYRRRWPERVKIWVGERVGLARSCSILAEAFPDYDAYSLITDDSTHTVAGWDQAVEAGLKRMPNGVGLLSISHGFGDYVNFPVFSRGWIKTLGWVAPPKFFHYCWDTVAEVLGDETWIETIPPELGFIDHRHTKPYRIDRFQVDCMSFLEWCSKERRADVRKLKAAMV